MNPLRLFSVALLLLAGCTTPPLALPTSHPASAHAAEAPMTSTRSDLRADANTLRTRDQLTHAKAEEQGPTPMQMEGHEHP